MSDSDDPFDDIETLFDQLTQLGAATGDDMPIDIKDEGDAFVVVADLPGYDTDDISVELEDDQTLTLSAERTEDETSVDGDYVRQERHTDRVGRTITLPAPVDPTKTDASHENGVLTVRLTKQTDDEGTDIPVN